MCSAQTVFTCNIAQQGTLVEAQQDTPVSMKQREVAYVPFDVDVELSTPLEEIPQGDLMVYHLFSCWREGKELHTHMH